MASSSAAAVAASSFHGFHRRGKKVRLFSDQPPASTKVALNLDELSDYFLSPGVSGGVVRSFYDVSANALGTVGSNARVNLFDENDEHMCSLPLSLDTQLGAAQVDLHAGLASLCAGEKWSTIVKESESAARAKLSIIDRGERAGCEVCRYEIEQEKNVEKLEEKVRQLSSWDMPQCSGQRMLVVDETACIHLFDARQGRAVHRWPGSTLSLAQRDGHLIYAVCGGVCKGRRQQVSDSFLLKAFDVRYDPTIMSSRITHGMYPVRGLSHALPPGTPVALADAGQDGILLYLYSNEGVDHVRVYDMRSPTRGSVQLKLRPDDEVTGMVGATLAGPSPQQQVVCISTKTCLVVYMLQDILKSRSFLEVEHISEERAVAPCVRHQIVGSNSDSPGLIGKDDFIVGMHRCPAGRLQFAFTHTSAGSTALDLDLLVDA